LTTLFIRHPARADGEGALCRFVQVSDGGAFLQQGDGSLRNLGDLIAASRRVVLLLAATDVTLLKVPVPPLSQARLRTALPALVEEHILGDPADVVLVASPELGDGTRAIAVLERAWFESLVRTVLAQGARAVAALPSQLCLPLQPGSVSGAIGDGELVLPQSLYQGLGIALDATPDVALQTALALAGDAPLVLYVPQQQVGEYQALVSEADAAITVEADQWAHWIAGSKSTTLDLVPGLGSAGAPARDWRRWRWPVRLALLALVVNLAGLNIEWLRMRAEADAIRQSMVQTFRTAYPKETVILDPLAQMRKNIAAARASTGRVGADEFNYMTAAFGEAARSLGRQPGVASIEYRERALTVKVKPESLDPALAGQLRTALAARNLSLTEAGPGLWQIRSTGVKQ
jgi:general secretion pathway protein L